MAKTFALSQQVVVSGQIFQPSVSASAGASAEVVAEAITAGTDTLVNIAFPYANVKAYYLYSTTACTIETNATDATGGQSISLAAGVPKIWVTGGDGSNVFSANVTKFYVTNVADTVLTAVVLYDPTP